MNHSVDDVVAYILTKSRSLSTVKLQKLLYYCHGWNLAFNGEPMFQSRIEAWKFGPVVREVYAKHRKAQSIDAASWIHGDASKIEEPYRSVIDAVWDTYGGLPAFKLAEMTHEETPYKKAWAQNPPGTLKGIEIPDSDISEFFIALRSGAKAE